MRPLVFDFADDEEALKQDIEYMFGQSLLVHPIVEKSVNSYRSYLPQHTGGWYDFWTGKSYAGNQYIDTEVGLETIPVFVKGGSILPWGPAIQHSSEKSDEPLALRIYPGADATFCLYEDEGTNHNYESGACSRIPISWDEKQQTLTIGKRQGSFVGMQQERTFVLVKGEQKREVLYQGKKIRIKW
jgi:alpha-D-xyloside xylohydrolase